MKRRTHGFRCLVPLALAIAVTSLVGCSADGDVGSEDAGDEAEATNPDVSLPDVSLPDVSVPAGDGDGSGITLPELELNGGNGEESAAAEEPPPDDNGNWLTALAMILITIAGLAWVLSIVSEQRRDRDESADRRRQAQRRVDGVIDLARWAEHQATQVLLSPNPGSLAPAQVPLQTHFARGESDAAYLSAEVDDADLSAALGSLGRSLATLRGGLTSYLGAASNAGTSEEELASLKAMVESQRDDLDRVTQQALQYSAALV